MDFSERYNRHLILPEFGNKGQEKLSKASVLLIGVGGLGSPIALYLVAAGIGKLGIVENDEVSISNLQRQILYKENQLGKPKAVCAKENLLQLNSTTQIEVYNQRFTQENAIDLAQYYDILVDGTDNFNTRYLINDVAMGLNKPYVYGSIGEYKGQIAVFNYQGSASYRCLYPQSQEKEKSASVLGVLGVLPGIIGSLEAAEVIKIITGCGTVMQNKLLTVDLQTMLFKTFNFLPDEEEKQIGIENFNSMKTLS